MWISKPRRSDDPRATDLIDREVGVILGDRRFEVGEAAASVTTRTPATQARKRWCSQSASD